MENKKERGKAQFVSGNIAAAYAAHRARPDVVVIYPITPQTSIGETIADLHAQGLMRCKLIQAESEHSVMTMITGAAAGGSRTFAATSSQGLLYMVEGIYWAAGSRMPIVMVNVNRSVGAPWAIGADRQDSMSVRDAGWMQFYCEDAQEAHDSLFICYKLSETLLLPSMLCYGGFEISHAYEPVIIRDQEDIDMFLPPYEPRIKLDPDKPYSLGNVMSSSAYAETRCRIHNDMQMALNLAPKLAEEYKSFTGGDCAMIIEEFNLDQAETVVVAMGAEVSTIKEAIDGKPDIGLLKLKMFRPFPKELLRAKLQKAKKVIVIDRSLSFGHGGHIWTEIRASMINIAGNTPKIFGYVAGLNGEIITPAVINNIINDASQRDDDSQFTFWRR